MAKLIFLLDGNVIKEYPLDKERMSIGRRGSNDVHIDNLAISGEHAVIVTIGDDAFIEDLNSTNGTHVNKKQIKKHMLKHGDDINLGKYKLKYVKDGNITPPGNPSGFTDTVLVTPTAKAVKETPTPENVEAADAESDEAVVEQQVEPVKAASESSSKPEASEAASEDEEQQGSRLIVLSGDDAGQILSLDKSMVKVGEPGVQVAVITKRADKHFITHVSGDNYPFVNGKRIGAQACELKNHDEIEVLDIKMEYILD